jgi:1,2-diacylglycerol 3-alpha-glucosyltransferase
MKIAIFTDFYFPQVNGVVTSTNTLVLGLEKQGHEVLVIGPRMEGARRSTDKVWRFRSVPFPLQKEYRVVSPISRKLKKFKDLNIDLIHIQTPFSLGHLGQFLSWKNNIPMIHTYHTYWYEYAHYVPFISKRMAAGIDSYLFTKNFCNRCQHIIAPSEQMKNKLLEYGVIVETTILPTGIDLEKTKKPVNTALFREKYNIDTEAPVMIFAGRLGIEKNLYFLLDSFKLVLEKEKNVVLFVAGDGPEKENMMKTAGKLGISDKVVFAGYLSHQDVFAAYAAADVIMFPSKSETQGLSLLEGMAMEKPAVGINAMGVASILENDFGGFLTSDDIDEYSCKVLELINDKKLYQQKKKEAKKRAEQFSSENMIAQTLDIYKKAIEIKAATPSGKTPFEKFFKGAYWLKNRLL